jgi:hypothetical protein
MAGKSGQYFREVPNGFWRKFLEFFGLDVYFGIGFHFDEQWRFPGQAFTGDADE